eukprot:TRINITY_DN19162_c0_g1_i6.p1 TRINITY_DN19162_c0_g1~~TRINITY_DN19162_c0_g1_i6.p1  ORF type:complete len:117 (+),score=11.11 TRINITY_DN19162_c0_g1_i6:133-483(+)
MGQFPCHVTCETLAHATSHGAVPLSCETLAHATYSTHGAVPLSCETLAHATYTSHPSDTGLSSLPGVAEHDGPKVVLVADDTTDGLVDGPRGLLSVPLLARETLTTHHNNNNTAGP